MCMIYRSSWWVLCASSNNQLRCAQLKVTQKCFTCLMRHHRSIGFRQTHRFAEIKFSNRSPTTRTTSSPCRTRYLFVIVRIVIVTYPWSVAGPTSLILEFIPRYANARLSTMSGFRAQCHLFDFVFFLLKRPHKITKSNVNFLNAFGGCICNEHLMGQGYWTTVDCGRRSSPLDPSMKRC